MVGVKAPRWATITVVIPIFSGFVWLGMLLGMLLWWTVKEDSRKLVTMEASQDIAFVHPPCVLTAGRKSHSSRRYISDVGAQQLQPLFIAMGTVTVVSFTSVFIAERWLRHRGTLTRNTSLFQEKLAGLAILFALLGMCGMIVLTCYNNLNHSRTHHAGLVLFIGGYMVSAIFVCWEYQRLGIHYRQFRILRISFWIKLAFIFVELGLAIAFGVLGTRDMYDSAAICEWVIALIYTFYIWSYAIDFVPAVRAKHYGSQVTAIDMAEGMERESRTRGYPGGVVQEEAAYRAPGPAGGQQPRNF
ncbi:hypothetical protein JHW43_008460 [Diplocarpon mali]|nr:hypothetical protein JHW43_008460 [Diplocarpon mali]